MDGWNLYQTLADIVLITHVMLVAFVVLGLVIIILGNLLHWAWVNNLWFRLAHVGTIVVVVAEAWLGVVCPVTTLETWLRQQAGAEGYQGGFIEHWLQSVLYYNAPEWVFVTLYTLFGLMVIATFWWFPPRFKRR
ncbi:DUF2784 domain-containing protein [Pseudomonas sp. gcc21]|uniref:DUF2784 domain-containing protein n=1 Tax=Pseudomonas sp. gcc21 TaxID=2726989 RepID=UPI001451552A|nr:DUF2784 domain-containing protein [Pseudomonas sp. gcc21]QJD60273.1 DUF2784 domain-containing protein [Pseudomonas sp. gcc21]